MPDREPQIPPGQTTIARGKIIDAVNYTVLPAEQVRQQIQSQGFFSLPKGTAVEVRVGLQTSPYATSFFDLGELRTNGDIQTSLVGVSIDNSITLEPSNQTLRDLDVQMVNVEKERRLISDDYPTPGQLTPDQQVKFDKLQENDDKLLERSRQETPKVAQEILNSHRSQITDLAKGAGINPNILGKTVNIQFIGKTNQTLISSFPEPPWRK